MAQSKRVVIARGSDKNWALVEYRYFSSLQYGRTWYRYHTIHSWHHGITSAYDTLERMSAIAGELFMIREAPFVLREGIIEHDWHDRKAVP